MRGTLAAAFWLTALGALLACSVVSPRTTPAWAIQAQAGASNKEWAQVVLFTGEIRDGQRIDRDDPYLPPLLDEEARHGRAENYDRCKVAVDIYQQTGQVRRVGFDDPTTLFTVRVDGARWAEEGPDEVVLEDLACFFAAGDVRRKVVFPVADEKGRRLGIWRYGRLIPED